MPVSACLLFGRQVQRTGRPVCRGTGRPVCRGTGRVIFNPPLLSFEKGGSRGEAFRTGAGSVILNLFQNLIVYFLTFSPLCLPPFSKGDRGLSAPSRSVCHSNSSAGSVILNLFQNLSVYLMTYSPVPYFFSLVSSPLFKRGPRPVCPRQTGLPF